MQTWDSVKIKDPALEAFGRAGTVKSAGVYEGKGEKKGETVRLVDVQLDGDGEATVFRADQVEPLS